MTFIQLHHDDMVSRSLLSSMCIMTNRPVLSCFSCSRKWTPFSPKNRWRRPRRRGRWWERNRSRVKIRRKMKNLTEPSDDYISKTLQTVINAPITWLDRCNSASWHKWHLFCQDARTKVVVLHTSAKMSVIRENKEDTLYVASCFSGVVGVRGLAVKRKECL